MFRRFMVSFSRFMYGRNGVDRMMSGLCVGYFALWIFETMVGILSDKISFDTGVLTIRLYCCSASCSMGAIITRILPFCDFFITVVFHTAHCHQNWMYPEHMYTSSFLTARYSAV